MSEHHIVIIYKKPLAVYVRMMKKRAPDAPEYTDIIVRDILSAPEFDGLRLLIFALLLWVIYGDGPRAAWVPWGLLPMIEVPVMRLWEADHREANSGHHVVIVKVDLGDPRAACERGRAVP